MLKKTVQQGRSERRGEAYSVPYVEPLSKARTKLADFFSILLNARRSIGRNVDVVVTSVLQTTAGRMNFMRMKKEAEREELQVARG